MSQVNNYFVSPSGAAAAAGSKSQPFRTLAQALQAARLSQKPATVFLRGGTYYLDAQVCLTPEDRGIAFCAFPGETPVISGGMPLDLEWEPYRDGIWKAKLHNFASKLGARNSDFSVPNSAIRIPNSAFPFDQLFVNGERQILARYPNFDPNERIFNGYAADCISPERVRRWSKPAGGFLHAMHSHLWGGFHYRINGRDTEGNLQLEGGWQNNRQSEMHKEFRFVEGIFEELDAPGEWFLDGHDGILYFYPPYGLDLSSATIEGVRLDNLVELAGTEKNPVRDISFHGITFRHTARTFMETREPLLRSDWTIYRGAAILFKGCENCRMDDCFLDQLGGNAVMVSGYNRNVSISGCMIEKAGAGGISFVGLPSAVRNPLFEYSQTLPLEKLDRTPGPLTNEYPSDCLVDDCLITRVGQFEKQAAGVQIAMSRRITVRHCSIYDVPRAGINIGDGCWGGHVIEFCDVFDTVKETGDHGSFNSWGRDRYWVPDIKETDNRVATAPDLPFLDAVEPNVLRNNRWRCDHGWDIDLDDGSSNYIIENNLCLNGGIKLREGYRRVCKNNIMANNSFHPHVWYANSQDIFRNNIVFGDYKPIRVNHPWGKECDFNFLHKYDLKDDTAALTLQGQSGDDSNSRQGNAHFRNPEKGNYSVENNSTVLAMGFVNFTMDCFGVRNVSLRKMVKTPVLPCAETAGGYLCPPTRGSENPRSVEEKTNRNCYATISTANSRNMEVLVWNGFRVRNIVGMGDVSAAGLPDETGVLVLEDQSGLLSGDVILKINDMPVKSLSDLSDSSIKSRNHLKLSIWRNQRRMQLEMK